MHNSQDKRSYWNLNCRDIRDIRQDHLDNDWFVRLKIAKLAKKGENGQRIVPAVMRKEPKGLENIIQPNARKIQTDDTEEEDFQNGRIATLVVREKQDFPKLRFVLDTYRK